MFGLDLTFTLLLIFCILCACAFEFINGFHDTANAVATVIYTHSLKPRTAVILSGILNFLGVLMGGVAVAMGIVNLLPTEILTDTNIYHSLAMILAILFAAIIWNLGTWYLGIPCSSSHTMIGSILGVGLAFQFIPGSGEATVNWSKAYEIGLSLLISPLIGFLGTLLLVVFLRNIFNKNDRLFTEPSKTQAPPWWIRIILILTCSGVSFSHGSNDGQKGVGLVMLILIAILPTQFALKSVTNPSEIKGILYAYQQVINQIDVNILSEKYAKIVQESKMEAKDIEDRLTLAENNENIIAEKDRVEIRKDVLLISKHAKKLIESDDSGLNGRQKENLHSAVSKLKKITTDYAPTWVLMMIAISLGVGTTIGWKRIVLTIGERIGKTHLTYAQGASAELIAMSTIGLASWLGLPVSTTQVLSSGIAGSMAALGGLANLRSNTIRSIFIAWVLTFPVCVGLSAGLFLLFWWMMG
ncbi:MAG: inorganic phosphate transporter [Cytophagales bacterium]|nr:inorganic phosphate transporter [Cytophagales bacterium]MDW8383573.1 inorganic phosphate transporter [Flammeovirgaceae bacterium]